MGPCCQISNSSYKPLKKHIGDFGDQNIIWFCTDEKLKWWKIETMWNWNYEKLKFSNLVRMQNEIMKI